MEIVIATLFVVTVPPVIYIFYTLLCNHFRNQFFQKNLPSLPILEDQKPLIGHLHIAMSPRNWRFYENGHKKLKKYFGFYIGNQRAISTIDLDLIKKFAVDEENHDRAYKMDLAFEETEKDCIFTARGDQWRRLRKALAPAFS